MIKRPNATWLLWSGLLAVVVFAVFANSLQNSFVFDDMDVVLGDPHVRALGDIKGLLADSYRPLRTITYAIDYAVWGLNPLGFRLTNIAIHAANTVLAFFLARKLTDGALLPSLVAALVFAVHPVQVESVAYISGRRDVLFALFYIAAFFAYTRFRDAETTKARLGWLAATGAGFLLGLMSKEMAASLPIACLLWDVYRATEPEGSSVRAVVARLVREGAIIYGAAVVALGLFAWYTIFVRGATTRIGSGIEFWGGSPLNNLLTVPLTYAHYAKLTVWPVTLAAQYYGAFDPAAGLSDPRVVPAILFLVGLAVASIYLIARTRFRVAGFGIAWFLVTLLPASQILPHHEIVADHYLYLPLVGVGLALADVLVAIGRLADAKWHTIAYGAAAVVILLLAGRTIARDRDWRDEATLWEATYAAVPQSPRAAYNYGLVLTTRSEHQRAIPLYQQAIEGDPTFIKAYFNLASTYAGLGRIDDAREVYHAALESDIGAAARTWHMEPDVLRAMYRTELAMLDAQAGDTAGAKASLATILSTFPDLLRAEDFFANVVQMRGEREATIDDYRRKVAESPDVVANRLVLANLFWKAGKIDDAYQQLNRAAELNPNSCFANLYLARFYRDYRPGAAPAPGAAAAHFDQALRVVLTPFDAETVRRARGDA